MSTAEELQLLSQELQPPVDEAIAEFERVLASRRMQEAGELAYAIAVRLQAAGRVRDAAVYGKKCYEIFGQLPSSTLDQVTATRREVAGVSLPDLMHEGVVRSRLGHLL